MINENKMIIENKNYIGGEYRVAEVSHNIDGPYLESFYFKVDIDVKVVVDNIVVVDSQRGLSLGKVIAIHDNNVGNANIIQKAKAWIVSVVDMVNHKKRIDATVQRAYIIKQLEERKEAMDAVDVYARLAENDPEAKKLVDQLKLLGN